MFVCFIPVSSFRHNYLSLEVNICLRKISRSIVRIAENIFTGIGRFQTRLFVCVLTKTCFFCNPEIMLLNSNITSYDVMHTFSLI